MKKAFGLLPYIVLCCLLCPLNCWASSSSTSTSSSGNCFPILDEDGDWVDICSDSGAAPYCHCVCKKEETDEFGVTSYRYLYNPETGRGNNGSSNSYGLGERTEDNCHGTYRGGDLCSGVLREDVGNEDPEEHEGVLKCRWFTPS